MTIQVRMLLDEGADKGLVDLQGMTAKDHAKEKECVTIIGEKYHGDWWQFDGWYATKSQWLKEKNTIRGGGSTATDRIVFYV